MKKGKVVLPLIREEVQEVLVQSIWEQTYEFAELKKGVAVGNDFGVTAMVRMAMFCCWRTEVDLLLVMLLSYRECVGGGLIG